MTIQDYHVPAPIRDLVRSIESSEALDDTARPLRRVAGQLATGDSGPILRGDWLGHALHPLLTDLPIGCWTTATTLDLVGGRRSATAAQRMVGLGLLAAVPTALSGLVDWDGDADDPAVRRAGLVHAVGNTVAAAFYFGSWRARRDGRRVRGIALGLVGGAIASGSGYLGAHLAFTRHSGHGERGWEPAAADSVIAVRTGSSS
ncbi:MAG: DUF2231 domain-containing protein [Acidimicrobiales bacterium]